MTYDELERIDIRVVHEALNLQEEAGFLFLRILKIPLSYMDQ